MDVSIVELPLAERFTISSGSWDVTRNVFVVVRREGLAGIGEVEPDDRAEGTAESVAEALEHVDLDALRGPFDLERVGELLPAGPARCALDIALHDLAARAAGISVADLLGCGGRPLPPTSVTVPIASLEEMTARAEALADHPVLKVKVGFDGDVDAVRAVRRSFDGALRIDANEGWDVATAQRRLEQMEPLDIELCEQPVPAADVGGMARVTASTPIPVFADEAARTAVDVAALAPAVDGVNLKLRKAGGIRETVRAIAVARAHGLGVMIGCDLESGVAAAAEASVAPLCDRADIDGPLLLRRDPWPGLRYDKGRMTLPQGPGLGVEAAVE